MFLTKHKSLMLASHMEQYWSSTAIMHRHAHRWRYNQDRNVPSNLDEKSKIGFVHKPPRLGFGLGLCLKREEKMDWIFINKRKKAKGLHFCRQVFIFRLCGCEQNQRNMPRKSREKLYGSKSESQRDLLPRIGGLSKFRIYLLHLVISYQSLAVNPVCTQIFYSLHSIKYILTAIV